MGKQGKQLRKREIKALSISHPNSRKAARLAKETIREEYRKKVKSGFALRRNIFGERILWLKEHLPRDVLAFTPHMTIALIDKYLGRFDEELEQIQLKHSIGMRKGRQHASREDVIRLTKERETQEFETCGFEMVDILEPKQLELLKRWTGDLNQMHKFVIKRYSRKFLEGYQIPKNSKAFNLLTQLPPLQTISDT